MKLTQTSLKLALHAAASIIVIVSSSSNALAGEGGSSPGGGDSISSRIRFLKAFFADGKGIKQNLNYAADVFETFPADGKMSAQIKDLIQRGLVADFNNAQYELKDVCRDAGGVERSATTTKVDLSNQKNPVRPSICLNARKLAMENAQTYEIYGLLFHEHARHFGLEDTDSTGMNPIGDYISTKVTDGLFETGELLHETKYVAYKTFMSGTLVARAQDFGHSPGVDGLGHLRIVTSRPVRLLIEDLAPSKARLSLDFLAVKQETLNQIAALTDSLNFINVGGDVSCEQDTTRVFKFAEPRKTLGWEHSTRCKYSSSLGIGTLITYPETSRGVQTILELSSEHKSARSLALGFRDESGHEELFPEPLALPGTWKIWVKTIDLRD